MDRIKWLWITCAIVTFVGVVLSVFSLLLISDMAEKAEITAARSEEFFYKVDRRVDQIEATVNSISANVTTWLDSTEPDPDPDVEADVLFDSICIREKNGKIAVYTSNGIHLRTLNVDISTLPEADQAALRNGITVNSWRELFALIEDLN